MKMDGKKENLFLLGLVVMFAYLARSIELGKESEVIDLYKLYAEHVKKKNEEKLRADHDNYLH